MDANRRGGRSNFNAGYFDLFWGCPACQRALSIAEIIENHCEGCDSSVQPLEMMELKFADEISAQEESA